MKKDTIKQISFIVPYYNHAASMPALLESMLSQSYKHIEVIIIDDCSDEPCDHIVAPFVARGLNISLVKNTERQFAQESRLIGFERSKGDIIAFADADDTLWGTEALAEHAMRLTEENADILHFNSVAEDTATSSADILHESAPVAEVLEGHAIFDTHVSNGCGPILWNKLYSRKLWEKVLPHARSASGYKARNSDDFYLTALLMLFAEKYISSPRLGYCYQFTTKAQLHERAGGRLLAFYHMELELVPLFRELRGSPAVEIFASAIRRRMRDNLQRLHHHVKENGVDSIEGILLPLADSNIIAKALLFTAVFCPTRKKKKKTLWVLGYEKFRAVTRKWGFMRGYIGSALRLPFKKAGSSPDGCLSLQSVLQCLDKCSLISAECHKPTQTIFCETLPQKLEAFLASVGEHARLHGAKLVFSLQGNTLAQSTPKRLEGRLSHAENFSCILETPARTLTLKVQMLSKLHAADDMTE